MEEGAERGEAAVERVDEEVVDGAEAMEEVPGLAEACRRFPMPDADTAAHVQRELGWGEQFVGTRMLPSKGGSDLYLYSLRSAAIFLLDQDAASASMRSKGMIKLIDIDGFVDWVGATVGDAVLAEAMAADAAEVDSYNDKLRAVQMLLDLRMVQYECLT